MNTQKQIALLHCCYIDVVIEAFESFHLKSVPISPLLICPHKSNEYINFILSFFVHLNSILIWKGWRFQWSISTKRNRWRRWRWWYATNDWQTEYDTQPFTIIECTQKSVLVIRSPSPSIFQKKAHSKRKCTQFSGTKQNSNRRVTTWEWVNDSWSSLLNESKRLWNYNRYMHNNWFCLSYKINFFYYS